MQFLYLSMRNTREWLRKWPTIVVNILVSLLIATMIGMGAWHDMDYIQYAANNIKPVMFFTVIHQGVISSLQGCFAFPAERAIMLRERASGAYYVSSYFVSKSLVDMVFQTIPCIFFSLCMYGTVGLHWTGARFFTFMTLQILCALTVTSVSAALSCICVTVELTTIVLACYLEISRLYSAFFVAPITIDKFPHWKWADAISYMKYTFVGLCINQYQGETFECGIDPVTQKSEAKMAMINGTMTPTCLFADKKYTTGEQVMAVNGYDMYELGDMVYSLFIFIFLARFIGWMALRFIKF